MRVAEYNQLGRALNEATGGWLTICQELCKARGLDLHMSVQTHHEGLPRGQMKLCCQAFDADDKTALFFHVDLKGKRLQILGWNLYLHETFAQVRKDLSGAQDALRKLDEDQGVAQPHPDAEALLTALRGLLGPDPVTPEA